MTDYLTPAQKLTTRRQCMQHWKLQDWGCQEKRKTFVGDALFLPAGTCLQPQPLPTCPS